MKFRLSRFIPLSFLACALQIGAMNSAEARVGETVEQCIARYGEVVSTIPSRTGVEGNFIYLFRMPLPDGNGQKELSVQVDFMNGQACYVRVQGKIGEAELSSIRNKNQGPTPWEGPAVFNERSYWKSKGDAGRFAAQYKVNETFVVEIFTADYASILKKQALATAKSILGDLSWNPIKSPTAGTPGATETKPEGPAASGLDKF